jgi:hypothetical protein
MLTALGHPTYYTVICKKESIAPGCLSPLHLYRGCYADIRDAIHIMIHYRRKYADLPLVFLIECNDRRPIGWLHPSRYQEE